MFILCCIICCIAGSCLGSQATCGKDIIKLNGILGHSISLENVHLQLEGSSPKLKKIIGDSRTIIYPKSSKETSRYSYTKAKSSIDILNLKMEDEGSYELTVEMMNNTEKFCSYDLKLYEEIASLRIDISHSPQNDSCVVTMNCVLQGGNYVTFSWTRDQEDLHHNSSILVIPVTRQNANSTFSCKAQNPVSSNWSRITLQQHCKPIAEPYINNNIIIYIATCSTIALLLVATLIIGILSRRYCIAKGKSIMQTTDQQQRQPHPVSQPVTLPVAEFGQHVHTVYAKVHKKESLDNIPNTVYALAGPMKAEP